MRRFKKIVGSIACFVAIICNINYARGNYGSSVFPVSDRGGNNPPCTATDAFGQPMECDKMPVQTHTTELCLMYQYIVTVKYHSCPSWRSCTADCTCSCCSVCHCKYGGQCVTETYYFSSGSQAEAYAQAQEFLDGLDPLDTTIDPDSNLIYSFTYVPTELEGVDCLESPHSTCRPETGTCPDLVAS